MPRVSVIMTVYDGARYVAAAVESVLAQTYADLELIVVDDASRDATLDVLAPLAERDPRLRVVALSQNVGPFVAANQALERSDSAFIARLDADDLCHPERLARQLALLDAQPAVGLVGSDVVLVDAEGRRLGVAPTPYGDLAIRWQCLLRTPLHHSAACWRRSLGLRYDAGLRIGGDYELWSRMLTHTEARNQKSPVVSYRVWKGGITGERRREQRRIQDQISARTIAAWLPDLELSPAALSALRDQVIVERHHTPPERPPASERRALAELYRGLFHRFMAGRAPSREAELLARAVDRRAHALVEDR